MSNWSAPTTSTLRAGLAFAFAVLLIGVVHTGVQHAGAVVSLFGFAVAISFIAAALAGWDRMVGDARAAGLVER